MTLTIINFARTKRGEDTAHLAAENDLFWCAYTQLFHARSLL